LWPGWVHKRIIRKVLNPYIGHGLTKTQLKLIIEGGVYVDKYYQAPELSSRHSMRDGKSGQSVSEAVQARDEWVNENISDFKSTGNYRSLGFAIHAMSDEHSPTHSWKPWYGQSKWNPSSWIHLAGELNPLGRLSKAFKLSVILVIDTYTKATSESSPTPDPTPSPSPTPGPDPVPVPPVPPVAPPSPDPQPIPPPPPPPVPIIIYPPLIIPRPNG
jgi:hypothetical protein